MSRMMRWTGALIAVLAVLLPATGMAAGSSEQAAEEDVTLQVTFRTTAAYEPDSEVELQLEEILGFEIEFDARPPLEYAQTTQAILASGDYPDLLEAWFANAEVEIRNLAEDEVIVPLDDLIDMYGSNIRDARPFEGNWYRPLDDGLTYSILGRFNGYGFEYGWIVRQDWLNGLGLAIPQNLDDFREVAWAFTFDDPDGNGRNDTYGIDGGFPQQSRSSLFRYILSAYGVMEGQWEEVNGELVNWVVRPETKEALRFMRELYTDGVVDPEFALLQRPQWLENMRAGKYGMQFWWNTHLDAGTSNWWNEFTAALPDAEISFIPPAPDPQGRRRLPGAGVQGRNPSLLIFDSTPQPNRVAAIQFIDYLASEEGAELGAFGVRGEHWTMEDGRLVSFIDSTEEQAAAGTYLFGWIFRRNNFMPTSPLAFENIQVYEDYVHRPVFEDTVPAETEFGGVLGELVNSRFLRIQIEQGIDVDAEFEDFVSTWMDAGGREITQQKNGAWRASR